MRAFHLTGPSLDTLEIADVQQPRPGHGEMLVRMRAASLNYLDLAVASGAFPPPAYPFVPGTDGAGEVAELGPGVEGFAVGDRVVPHYMVDWVGGRVSAEATKRLRGVSIPGSLADYAVVPARALARLPAHLDFVEGATLPIAATTAWNGLRIGAVGTGSTVLLLGTGGVSLFGLQFAKSLGASVIVTSSSEEKLERARTLGADHIINYRCIEEWQREVLAVTDGKGADFVMETAGAKTFARSVEAAAYAGTIFVVGFVTGGDLQMAAISVMTKTLRIVGSQTGSIETFKDMVRAVEAGRIKPVIDRHFGLGEAKEAYRFLQAAGHFGKIAIDLPT